MHFNGAKLLSIFDILILESISIKDYRHNSTTTSRVDDPGVFRGSGPDPDPVCSWRLYPGPDPVLSEKFYLDPGQLYPDP